MLITEDYYRQVTGDQATNDVEIAERIDAATIWLAEELDRGLYLDEYTETLVVHPDRRVYPRAWPVAEITTPGGAEIDPEMDGRAIRFVDPDDQTFGLGYSGRAAPRPVATVTYTGGYASTVQNGAEIPPPLGRCIAQLAYALYTPAAVGVMAGATSVRLGDAAVTFARPASGLDELVPGISARLRPYYRREYG